MAVRHFISLFDFSPVQLQNLLDRAIKMKAMQKSGESHRVLEGKTLAMLFEQRSTRTRLGFAAGMAQLGGATVTLSAQETHLGQGESIEHTARVFSGMVDAVMIRTPSHERLEAFVENSEVPVINAMTSYNHPCQLLADMQTYRELRGDIKGATVAFLGDGYNMCNSYINATTQFQFQLRVACPKGYEPDLSKSADTHRVTLVASPEEAMTDADLVVTDVWNSMAHEKEGSRAKAERIAAFRPYQVTPSLLDKANKDVVFMHCLPAHIGEEVSEDMLDDRRSAVWQEASNRLHSQKALLELLLT